MITTHDLRDALADLERYAPPEADVLAELDRRRRTRRRPPLWSTGLLAAAAVVAIVGVGASAFQHTSAPAAPAVISPAATTQSPATTTTTAPSSSDPSQIQERQAGERSAEQQAQQAAQSAEKGAETAAAQAAAAAATCTRAQSSPQLTVKGHLDATRIAKVSSACARAYGAEAGYTAQWVQTTVGALYGQVTGRPQRGTTPVIAVQIQGTLTAGGQNGDTEALLLVLPLDDSLPTGGQSTGDPIDLSALGVVHHI